MATLVCFHAHPDDEAIATGGVMAAAAAAGHRVVLVTATRGEHGEPVPGVLRDGEQLWERRVVETRLAGDILGAERVEFLGYVDSGMMGEPTNDHPDCFWQADVDDAAERRAAILREVEADVLTLHDAHGVYGPPDVNPARQIFGQGASVRVAIRRSGGRGATHNGHQRRRSRRHLRQGLAPAGPAQYRGAWLPRPWLVAGQQGPQHLATERVRGRVGEAQQGRREVERVGVGRFPGERSRHGGDAIRGRWKRRA